MNNACHSAKMNVYKPFPSTMSPKKRVRLFLCLMILSGGYSWSTIGRPHCPKRKISWHVQRMANSNPSSSGKSNSSNSNNIKRPIYSQPALYDLAFGYRDFEEEVQFLWQRHRDVTGHVPKKGILEVAAGPARHALTALNLYGDALQTVHCIDASPEMAEYATELAQHELSLDEQDKFHYHVADMRTFAMVPAATVDTAWILLGSLQHMTTNDHVRLCFSSIHKALVSGGTCIIELPHPRETFSMVECTRNGWKVPLEDQEGEGAGELAIVWGDNDDAFDEVSQVRQFTISMSLTGTDDDKSIREVVPLRLFTAQEIEALAMATGFRVASLHGALEEGVSVNDDDAAYRLVVVLQKI